MATVRRAEQEDVDALRALMLEYIVDFYGWPRPDDDDLLELIETMLEGREGFQLVAEDAGSLVGFTTVYLTWETLTPGRVAIMNDLFVAESERGSGVAADLFRAAADEARARGCSEMRWETAPDNHPAQRFYEKVGGRREDWVAYSIDL